MKTAQHFADVLLIIVASQPYQTLADTRVSERNDITAAHANRGDACFWSHFTRTRSGLTTNERLRVMA